MNKFQVVGRVNNGRVSIIAVTERGVIGQFKPLQPKMPISIIKTENDINETIDSPFISMVQENRKRVKAEQEVRIRSMYA